MAVEGVLSEPLGAGVGVRSRFHSSYPLPLPERQCNPSSTSPSSPLPPPLGSRLAGFWPEWVKIAVQPSVFSTVKMGEWRPI